MNNAFRMIMQLPRYCSASNMFAMCNVPSCQAVMRNLVYRFTIRVDRSENKLLCAIGNSDMRYQSRIKKGVAMDTEPYPVVAGLLIRKAVT